MFKKSTKQQPLEINQQEISTIIGEGFTFKGELHGTSAIRVEGKITGNVNVEGGIVLGEKGIIEGNVTTRSAIIYGTIKGDIKTTQLEIKRTGFVHGNITTDTVEIELGAQYNGKLDMKREILQQLKEAS